jgi:hypothetical protein
LKKPAEAARLVNCRFFLERERRRIYLVPSRSLPTGTHLFLSEKRPAESKTSFVMSQSYLPKTSHALAERVSFDRIASEYDSFCRSGMAARLRGGRNEILLVFNATRQLVYADEALLKKFRLKNLDQALGLRLGEILGCAHAIDNLGGCGTQGDCVNCGAITSMLGALDGRAGSASCCVVIERDRREGRLKFDIRARPLVFEGNSWIAAYVSRAVAVAETGG